jgi:hypothetical protein
MIFKELKVFEDEIFFDLEDLGEESLIYSILKEKI